MRPGNYDENLTFIPPTESDLAPMPRSNEVKVLRTAFDDEMQYIPPTESDLAPMMKSSKFKDVDLQKLSTVTLEFYTCELIE